MLLYVLVDDKASESCACALMDENGNKCLMILHTFTLGLDNLDSSYLQAKLHWQYSE